ncbi:Alpha/Beta hydrolase protein [Mycena amicta]|nr:Alpha/Beta hydrolase protein [Mycena amicta]
MPASLAQHEPVVHHTGLKTSFHGVRHPASSPETPIHQYRGIQYATIPARFRQSHLCTGLPTRVDCSQYGPICPQLQKRSLEEELFGMGHDVPQQILEQNEFECLNLNITCPAGLTSRSRIPVMLWVHGGGDRGYGSSWIYDGGSIVRKSMLLGKPVMVVTFNFRIGFFGFAASPLLLEDNAAAGDVGVGNYGLRDQRRALEWLHRYIQEFGGDPNNVTMFGESSGAADILYHMQSKANEHHPLFQRGIVQSAIIDHNIPEVCNAGWHVSRVMSSLDVKTIEELRAVSADKLMKHSCGSMLRAVDDGHFFLPEWRTHLLPDDPSSSHHYRHILRSPSAARHGPSRSRSRTRHNSALHQSLMIGDTASPSLVWSLPASLWTSQAVIRRVNAICQSKTKATRLLEEYDIGLETPDDEVVDRVLELIGDARVAWPTEVLAARARYRRAGSNAGVWRYVFDQEATGPARVSHKADLVYLFDTVPQPFAVAPSGAGTSSVVDFCDSFDLDDDDDAHDLKFDSDEEDEEVWLEPQVDEYAYTRVRDAMQERWIAFAHGEAPWRADSVFVFGPEGEIGERSRHIFEGRRRHAVWQEALEPLGMQLVQKVGMELSRGPPVKNGKY